MKAGDEAAARLALLKAATELLKELAALANAARIALDREIGK